MGRWAVALGLALVSNSQAVQPATIPKDGAAATIPKPGPGVRQIDKNTIGVGDILLDTRVKVFAVGKRFWPGGVLPYAFEANVTSAQQAIFQSACEAWTQGTPVTCSARTTEADYVLVRTHNGNACGAVTSCSFVGKRGGVQYLSILAGHWAYPHIVQHELGHALGLIHEQNRADRDTYIFVREQNVAQDYYFDVVPRDASASIVSEYDYRSIMHYPNCGGANNGSCSMSTRELWTLEPKPCGLDIVGGTAITTLDKEGIRNAYASAIVGLFQPTRSSSCGMLTYGTDVVRQGCGGACIGVQSQDGFNKEEERSISSCGSTYVPNDWGHGQCLPINKVEISLKIHSANYACGPLHMFPIIYADAKCGCAVSTIAAKCTFGTNYMVPPYQSARAVGSWRAGRVQYFNQVLEELKQENIAPEEIMSVLPDFYFLNGADIRLESKLFRMRHKLASYARWKRKVNASFVISRDVFDGFAKREKLRTH